eukprot:450935-Amphidinium_carterae.2
MTATQRLKASCRSGPAQWRGSPSMGGSGECHNVLRVGATSSDASSKTVSLRPGGLKPYPCLSGRSC